MARAWPPRRPSAVRLLVGHRVAALALPGGRAVEAGQEVQPRRLELVADQAELQEEDPEVVLGGGGVEVAPPAAAGAGVDRLGAQGQRELDVGLHLAGVQGALEPAVLDRPPEPDVVEVDPAVASRVVVVRAVVVVAVPGPVHLLEAARAVLLDLGEEVRVDPAAPAGSAALQMVDDPEFDEPEADDGTGSEGEA